MIRYWSLTRIAWKPARSPTSACNRLPGGPLDDRRVPRDAPGSLAVDTVPDVPGRVVRQRPDHFQHDSTLSVLVDPRPGARRTGNRSADVPDRVAGWRGRVAVRRNDRARVGRRRSRETATVCSSFGLERVGGNAEGWTAAIRAAHATAHGGARRISAPEEQARVLRGRSHAVHAAELERKNDQ